MFNPDVLSRQLVLASVVAALLAGRMFMPPETGWAMLAAFVVTAGLSLVSRRAAAALVLGTAFIAPALVVLGVGVYYGPEAYVWFAALAALVAVDSWRKPWAIPVPMRWPLVMWALVVALTWPVVLLREANFSPALMQADRRFAGAVWIAASWIASVASNHMLGILWFDWLFRECDADDAAFARTVALPLSVSWLLTIALGAYQAAVNITFLNAGAHVGLGRASGGLMDANPFGVAVALWGPIVYVLCARMRSKWGQPVGIAALALSWYGMWVSGSRGAFGTAVIGLGAVMAAGMATDARRRRRTVMMLAGAAVVVAAVVYVAPTENSPIRRFAPIFNGITEFPLPAFLAERWDPYFYGRTAWRAVQDSPLFGIGLGTFPAVVSSYSALLGHPPLLVDNAQNWFRHQFTELGLIGSIGWAVWLLCAVALLVSPPRNRPEARIGKGALVASAAVSLIGMPGQNIAFTLVFWTCAFFLWQHVVPRWPGFLLSLGRTPLVPVALAVVCAAGTAVVGWRTLMPATRAARFNEFYAFGVADFVDERGHGGFTMRRQRALAVIHPTSRFLKLSVARDAKAPSATVHVSVDRHVLVSVVVSQVQVVRYLTLRDASHGVVVDSRSEADPSEAGDVYVRWEFLPAPE